MGRFVAWFGGLVILCAGVAGAAEAGVAVTNLPAGAGSTALPVEARLPPKYRQRCRSWLDLMLTFGRATTCSRPRHHRCVPM